MSVLCACVRACVCVYVRVLHLYGVAPSQETMLAVCDMQSQRYSDYNEYNFIVNLHRL